MSSKEKELLGHELCERGLGGDPDSEERRAQIIAKLVGAQHENRIAEALPPEVVEHIPVEQTDTANIGQYVGTVAAFSSAFSEPSDRTNRGDL